VTFTPTESGDRAGSIAISDSAGTGTQNIAVDGVGTQVKLAPTSVNFGDQQVGTKSAAKAVKLTNVGTTALNISGVNFGGPARNDYAQTNNCGNSVGAGQSCTFNITFKPSNTGTRNATMSIKDDGGASPQVVLLTGNGT
jgi:hypothetical protein